MSKAAGFVSEQARRAVAQKALPFVEEAVRPVHNISVRVSPGPYLAFSFVLFGLALWCVRSGADLAALALLAVSFIAVPVALFFERVSFDGAKLWRRGPLSSVRNFLTSQQLVLNVKDIERVESSALRTLRNGGRVHYRYRSEISGNGISIVVASGGRAYRRMVRELFSCVSDEALDVRSRELRDYLSEPQTLKSSLTVLNFASRAVLDAADSKSNRVGRRRIHPPETESEDPTAYSVERARTLQFVANELRINGRLREASEAYRRASIVLQDGSIAFEIARLLRSLAGASRDRALARRSVAALQLAARRSRQEPELLVRVGETLFEFGEIERSRRIFGQVLATGQASYRACLGLAEIALREGKLAHVIHQYNNASRVVECPPLSRFAEAEAAYFSRLNNDDEYLEKELSRIGWLQNSERARAIALKIATVGMVLALVGPALDEKTAGFGWSVSLVAGIIWLSAVTARKKLSRRRHFGAEPA